VYLEWRARLAAKHEARRTQEEGPPEATPNPMWDPARLFEPAAPAPGLEADPVAPPSGLDASHDAIDLRTPLDLTVDLDRAPEPSPPPSPIARPPRRRALAEKYASVPRRPVHQPQPSIAEALRELNEHRVAGTISEAEFKARKAELFS
jgi:hypothetical protein